MTRQELDKAQHLSETMDTIIQRQNNIQEKLMRGPGRRLSLNSFYVVAPDPGRAEGVTRTDEMALDHVDIDITQFLVEKLKEKYAQVKKEFDEL
jgi:hypothetical protein